MNIEVAIQAIRDIKSVFNKYKIDFWLNDGTLLGAIRDKAIIPWDCDIDLAMWEINPEKVKTLSEELSKLGYNTYIYDDSLCVIKGDCIIDIDFKIIEDGFIKYDQNFPINGTGRFLNYILWCLNEYDPNIRHNRIPNFVTKFLVSSFKLIPSKEKIIDFLEPIYLRNTKLFKIEIPAHFYTKLKNINFYGMKVKVPFDSEGYLKYKYGANWETPQKDRDREEMNRFGAFQDGFTIKGEYIYKKGKWVKT